MKRLTKEESIKFRERIKRSKIVLASIEEVSKHEDIIPEFFELIYDMKRK